MIKLLKNLKKPKMSFEYYIDWDKITTFDDLKNLVRCAIGEKPPNRMFVLMIDKLKIYKVDK